MDNVKMHGDGWYREQEVYTSTGKQGQTLLRQTLLNGNFA